MKKYEFELWGSKYRFSTSKPIVIVDLDGTLSDGTHRLHLLPTDDLHLTESWYEFNKAAVGDSPIKSTVAVVNGLWMSGFAVVILTGRSDEVMEDTSKWLSESGVKYDALIMRRKEDNRKDTIIKEEVLRAIGLENIVCAFDDSPNVVKHFRSLGITTYQVTEYDKLHTNLQSHGVDVIKITERARFIGSKDSLINANFIKDKVYDVWGHNETEFLVCDEAGTAWQFRHNDCDFVNA
nr:MAG TPA: hypothetical protein [Caudoviricetes sp.]